MTEHDRFLELAAISTDFELTPDERRELDDHLAACPACRSAVADLADQGPTLASLPAIDAPDWVRRTVLAAASSPRAGRGGSGLFAARVALVTAIAVAPLTLAVVLLRDLDLGIGFGAPAGAPTEPGGRIAWQPVERGPEATGAPGERTPAASGPPASGAPPELRSELMAVALVDDRIVAVGRACDPTARACRAAAVTVDGNGRAFETDAEPALDVAALPDGSWAGMRDVAGRSAEFVAVGATDREGRPFAVVWRSEDGLKWDRVPDGPQFADAWMNAVVALDDGSYVAVGGASGGGGVSAAAWTSGDGLTWIRAPDAPSLTAGAGGAQRAGRPTAGMWDVAPAEARLVAAGAVCDAAVSCIATTWTSPDGMTWTRNPSDGLGQGSASAVAAVDDGIAVVGSGTSSALAWWLDQGFAVTQRAFSPARAGDLLAASSSNGLIAAAGAAGRSEGGIWLTAGDGWAYHADEVFAGATVLGIALDGDRIVAVGVIGDDPAAILIGRIEELGR